MSLLSKGDTLDKYGERVPKPEIRNVKCVASGSKAGRTGDKGESSSLSYTVQLENCPEIFVGDKIPELKTCQGQVLFINGQVRRVTPLIEDDQGVVAQVLSVLIQK